MKIIDLSGELYSWMSVFPGDPEVSIKLIQTIEQDDCNMSRVEMNSHDGTHVNAPIHMKVWGENLGNYTIEDFVWEAVLYEGLDDIEEGVGVIFGEVQDISWESAKKIVEVWPKFIGLTKEFDVDIERYLCENDVISFERLENTDKLPKKFFFHGAPLKIRTWDGSPVRAYAIID